MIHIATVHWFDDTWVDIQLDFLGRALNDVSFKIYAFLNGIDPERYKDKIHYISTEPIVAHITKLNLLAETISSEGSPEDQIWFIDGDAFPVGDIFSYVKKHLDDSPLVAIQRLENEGDPQPHPSFCATTIRFWLEIGGDWSKGPEWTTRNGKKRSDTGGVLWAKLKEKGIAWHPMFRSNRVDLHPLWFGLYENLIYHHGAAFRTPYCMIDIERARKNLWKRVMLSIADTRINRVRGGWLQHVIYSFVMKKIIEETRKNSQTIIEEMKKNPNFYRRFL